MPKRPEATHERLCNIIRDHLARVQGLGTEDAEGVAQRAAVAIVQAFPVLDPAWLPTNDAINALPGPVRHYVYDLETRADPSGEVAELTICRDSLLAMERRAVAAEEDMVVLETLLRRARRNVEHSAGHSSGAKSRELLEEIDRALTSPAAPET